MERSFKVGVGREIITPPLGTALYGYPKVRYAEGVHDDLHVTAFAFASATEQMIMISADICAHGFEEALALRKLVSKETGVPVSNITFSTIHTHSGPCTRESTGWGSRNDEYIENILNPMTVKAAKDAFSSMRDAVMGIGTTESLVGINRREKTIDGEIILGQNPWGIINKEMTVISFKDLDGNGIGTMIHYGAHCTSAGANTEVTRDWAGGMCDILETECGMPVAFFCGATGDTGPRLTNGRTTGNIKLTEALGSLAGIDAVRAYKNIREYVSPDIAIHTDKVRLPFEPLMPYEEAKAKLEELGDVTNAVGSPKKAASKYRAVMDVYEKNLPISDALEYEVCAISLGSLAFVTFPFEVFSEITIRIAHHSPHAHTLSLNNTNGSLAYFPTQSEMPLGGYEVFMFNHFQTQNLPADSDTAAVKEYVRILNELKNK